MTEFGFQNPGAGLWSVLLALAATALLFGAEKRRVALGRLLGLSGPFERRRILIPGAIFLVFSFSLARPYTGYEDTNIPGIGRDILLVIDVSRSMLAADASPNRLAAAKRKAADVIDRIEQTSPGDRVGIVLFAGDSYLFCPLTSDYAVVRVFASAISPELITSGGSALGKALELVAQSVEATGAVAPLVIVLSDGEDNTLETEAIGAKLHRRGIAVNVVALGTPEGRPIELPGGTLLKDDSGSIVVSKLNEAALSGLARATEGRYLRAAVADEDIAQILDTAAAKGQRTAGESVRTFHDVGPFLALIALLGMLIPFALAGRSRVGVMILLIAATVSPPMASADSTAAGATRYHAGDYAGAADVFRNKTLGPNAEWRDFQALGSAEYKQKRFKESLAAFEAALSRARTPREKFASLYNRGNARVMSGDYKGAVSDYDSALALKPDDGAAITNRDIARKLLAATPPPPPKDQAEKDDQSSSEQREDGNSERGQDGAKSDPSQENAEPKPSAAPAENSSGSVDSSAEKNSPEKEDVGESDPSKRDSTEDQKAAEGAFFNDTATTEIPGADNSTAKPGENPSPSASGGSSSANENRAEEAKTWLQALDDAPVLLEPRGQRRRLRGSQSW